MAQRKTDRQLLDEALAAQDAGTYVDPVQGAKAMLSKRSVVDDANAFADSETAAAREAETLTPMGTARRYGKPIGDAAKVAAIPAAFLSGPVGMAAGGYLALEGLNDAVKDPSMGNMAVGALGALPFVKPVRSAMKGMREASAIKGMRATEGAGDMGAAFSREVPYRAGSGTSGNAKYPMSDLAREAEVPINWRKPPSAFDEMMSTDFPQGSVVDDVPVAQGTPNSGEVDDVLAGLGARLDEIPGRGTARGGEDAFTNFESGSVPSHLATLDRTHDAAMSRMNGSRPAGDFVHPSDTTGGAFGFDELPEISENELTRLQALFKRLGI